MHPLGLNLDFLFGRGYLSARNRSLGQWATIESLRMEIPDLTFPFDARGGVDRFRNTRCHVRQLQMTIGESALAAALDRALEEIQGYRDLKIRFQQGAVQAMVRFETLGSDTFLTFKASVVPPEPARDDALHLLIYDVRAYGPVPYPARLLVSELVARLLATAPLRRPGDDKLYRVEHEGDRVEFRPLKLALMSLFPPAGWKMPSLAGVRFEHIELHPGALHISARSDGAPWEEPENESLIMAALSDPTGGIATALAAAEARELCHDADAALWDGQIEASIDILRGLRDRYGLHPAIVGRMLDALMASSSAGHLSEARALIEEMLRADPDSLHALMAAPTVALLRGDHESAIQHYIDLADLLRRRGEGLDLIAALLAAAMIQQRRDPKGAVTLLKEVTQLAPRNRLALELLRDMYRTLDRPIDLVDALRRLANLYTKRDTLLDIYQELADRLMDQRDLPEARRYLEKILRLDPGRLEALRSLGQSHLIDEQPLRALRAFDAAAKEAQGRGNIELAADLRIRIAQLWHQSLENPTEALLSCRRALALMPKHRRALTMGVELAVAGRRHQDALDFLDGLIPQVEQDVEQARGAEGFSHALLEARRIHLLAAEVSIARGRQDTAASHHRQALAYRRTEGFELVVEDDPSVAFLDDHYRQMGSPEDLLDLYRSELDTQGLSPARRGQLHRALAIIFDRVMRLGSEASEQLRLALDISPEDAEALALAVEIMRRDGRFYDLRDLLIELTQRLHERRARGLALRHLGALHLEALPDTRQAVDFLRQSMALRPADDVGASLMVQAERAMLIEDPNADQRPLLKALERLGEVGQDQVTRHSALVEAGDLCFERLVNMPMAVSFYQRAQTLRPDPKVAERLEIIRDRTGYGRREPLPAVLSPRPAPPVPAVEHDPNPTPVIARQRPSKHPEPIIDVGHPMPTPRSDQFRRLDEIPTPTVPTPAVHLGPPPERHAPLPELDLQSPSFTETDLVAAVEEALSDDRSLSPSIDDAVDLRNDTPSILDEIPTSQTVAYDLDTFRERLQRVKTSPADLSKSLSIIKRMGKLQQTEPPVQDDPLLTRAVAPLSVPSLDGSLSGTEIAASQTDTLPRAPAEDLLGALHEAPTPPPDDTPFQDAPTRPLNPVSRSDEDVQAERRLDGLVNRISEARDTGDPVQLSEVLGEAVEEEGFETERRARFARERGLLYYYDLEQPSVAEESLSLACDLDPDGTGRDFDVLTALEGIYEDMGQPERLLDVYRRKRDFAEDGNMKRVYTLLSAELLWERLGRAEEATEELQRVMQEEPDNAPALRMLSDIARTQGDIDASFGYLKQVIERQPAGSFELQDALREAGRLLSDHIQEAIEGQQTMVGAMDLDQARREAIAVYLQLLDEAPGDSSAISMLKPLMEQVEDYPGALKVLGMELRLLLGRREGFENGPVASEIDPANIVDALSIPISQILTEAASLQERNQDPDAAMALYERAVEAWPENIDALMGHGDLLRAQLSEATTGPRQQILAEHLVQSLETMAEVLLAPEDKFRVLFEAAEVLLDHVGEPQRAKPLLDQALDTVAQAQDPDPGTTALLQAATARRDDLIRMSQESAPVNRPHAATSRLPIITSNPTPREPGARLNLPPGRPAPPPKTTTGNPFGLPPLADLESIELPGNHGEGWSQAAAQDPPTDRRWRHEEPPPAPDLAGALQRAEIAEQTVDREDLIDALTDAVRALRTDPDAPAALRRQLHVRLAEALLGQRPQPPLGEPPLRYRPTRAEYESALRHANAALDIERYDEPDAHFACILALRGLDQSDQALRALERLVVAANHWTPEADGFVDDEMEDEDLELEHRIVAETLQTLTEGRAAGRRQEILERFARLNPRIASVLREEDL